MPSDDFCYLTTTGRRTGKGHEIEMWYARRDDTLYLLAGGGRGADWVQNLAVDPRASVRVDDVTYRVTSRLLDDPRDDREVAEALEARQLVFGKYQDRYDGSLDEWRERALPVALHLQGDS